MLNGADASKFTNPVLRTLPLATLSPLLSPDGTSLTLTIPSVPVPLLDRYYIGLMLPPTTTSTSTQSVPLLCHAVIGMVNPSLGTKRLGLAIDENLAYTNAQAMLVLTCLACLGVIGWTISVTISWQRVARRFPNVR